MHNINSFQTMPESDSTMPDYSEHSLYPASQIVPKVVLDEEVGCEDQIGYEFPSEKTYTNLETSSLKHEKGLQLFSEEAVDLKSWVKKDPNNWSPREVMDWLFYTAKVADIDTNDFRAHLFNRFTGDVLCTMPREHFLHLEPKHGHMLYCTLQRLLRVSNSTLTGHQNTTIFEPIETSDVISSPAHPHEYQLSQLRQDALLPTMEQHEDDCAQGMLGLLNSDADMYPLQAQETTEKCMKIQGHHYDFDNADMFPDVPSTNTKPEVLEDSNHSSLYASDCSRDEAYRAVFANLPLESVQDHTAREYKRQPGRPRKNPPAAPRDPNRPKSTRGRKPGQRTKGNHLWEFMRGLLMDSRYNKTHVVWQDKHLGVFMIAKSAEVAEMWGKQKKNPSMTYEKMSRSMRFCRKVRYFQAVPKDGRFPKKLCFRFGPMAEGWEIAR